MKKTLIADLQEVFGVSEVATTTGFVMVRPSSISNELVAKVVREFPLEAVLKDLGVVAARELANYIEAMAMRPADYAGMPDLGIVVAERIMQALGKDSEAFTDALTAQLRNRG